MDHNPAVPRMPRLRGLDPERMLGVLDDDVREPLPQIPGWRISGVAGEGGSGIVWRAVREKDGVAAAIKIAPPGEPETVERIEREAGFLRELRHPHIVELLEAGPLEEGSEAGGLYMAMEFIDGPALLHEIPESGLRPDQAFRWFREIASAVAHAHDAGILHRDLKPANVLIDPDGRVKVADFGLARPVHRRVHMLSLTRAGLVAGTAEYLPPEAYRRDYRPDPAADIFALGVMLHEMLTGTPPRGAWQPASAREGVDVRIDGIIRRAMDPSPERRWPDARAMVNALEAVLASPPRYAGAPLVTFEVRVGDCLWSVIGFLVLLAGTSTQLRLDKARLSLPLDLIGEGGRLTGGFNALFLLLLAAVPLMLWQLLRLRRFRHVPLREALPSPFGLPLGHGRMAAALVAVCQLLFLWLPALQMVSLFLSCGLTWLQPGDPPWAHGLAVTSLDDHEIISPWKFARNGQGFWLWESFGPPGHGLAKTMDRISFIPWISPAIMVMSGMLLAVTLLVTLWAACRGWWRRNHRVRTLGLAGVTPVMLLLLGGIYARESRIAGENRSPDLDNWVVDARMTTHLRDFADFLLGVRTGLPDQGGADWTDLYQETVDYRERGPVDRRNIPRLLEEMRPRADVMHLEVTHYEQSWNPADGGFQVRVRAVETFDGLQPTGSCGAADLLLELSGNLSLDGCTVIRRERLTRTAMYHSERRRAENLDVSTWAESFLNAAAMARTDPQQADLAFGLLFQPVPGGSPADTNSGWVRRLPDHRGGLPALLGAELPRASRGVPAVHGTLPGGRTRISIPFRSAGARPERVLSADLVRVDGSWRCVKLAF